jgi:hypothetical protein
MQLTRALPSYAVSFPALQMHLHPQIPPLKRVVVKLKNKQRKAAQKFAMFAGSFGRPACEDSPSNITLFQTSNKNKCIAVSEIVVD